MSAPFLNETHEKRFSILVLTAIAGVLACKHFFLYQPPGPILWDEWLYKENAELLSHGERFFSDHYPPLYSLVISIAFFFRNWYESIHVINGILSTLLVIPVWLIARMFVTRPFALLTVLLVLMLPFQAIYPGFVMSENLFLLLFAFAVYFSLQGADTTCRKAALMGISLGLAYLTRYLMLPAIPVMILFWITVPVFREKKKLAFFLSRRFLVNGLILASCLVLVMLPWFIYAYHSGFGIFKALGLSYTGSTSFSDMPEKPFFPGEKPGTFLMWGCVNVSYILLAVAPYLALLMFYLPGTRFVKKFREGRKDEPAFFVLLFLLTAVYWFVSVQHSFRDPGNYPVPHRLMGRYLLHLNPLFIISGMIALQNLAGDHKAVKKPVVVPAILAMILLVVAARWILFQKGIWNFPPGLADNYLDTPGTLFYNSLLPSVLGMILIGLTGLSFLLMPGADPQKSRILFLFILAMLVSWQGLIFRISVLRAKDNISGIHARKISNALASRVVNTGNLPMFYSIRYTWPEYWASVPHFWGDPKLSYIADVKTPCNTDTLGTILFLTEDSLPARPVVSYRYRGGTCYLYKLDPDTVVVRPEIRKFGPGSLTAGKDFNVQSSGESALWMKATIFSKATVVCFDGRELKTWISHDNTLWAVVPKDLYRHKGRKEVYLYDKFFRAQSRPVTLEVK